MGFWNNYFMEKGLPTNQEFFSSNAKGCFYEGMVRDENGEWVESQKTIADREEIERTRSCHCGLYKIIDCKYGCKQFEDD